MSPVNPLTSPTSPSEGARLGFEFQTFDLLDMVQCGAGLRRAASGADSMEDAARSVVEFLHDNFDDGETGERACPLIRFYKTHALSGLEPDTRAFVLQRFGDRLPDGRDVKCLTLLASVGFEADWNDRLRSSSHRAIPLPSVEVVEQAPMIAQLIEQFGVDLKALLGVGADDVLIDRAERDYNVFHVQMAEGSPHIPAQDDFVVPYGIRSVLGFGGVLPSGELFAVIMFSRVDIPQETADLFRSVALSVELAVLPFPETAVFRTDPSRHTAADPDFQNRHDRAARIALDRLATVSERVTVEQMVRLRSAQERAETHARQLEHIQASLRESQAHSEAIVSSALDCVITMDAEGRITEFNPAAERTFGYTRDEVLGRELGETIVPASHRAAHTQGLARYLETGHGPVLGRRIELTGLRADGTEFPIELAVIRVEVPGPPRFVGYLRDISGRVHAQRALEESRERFAHVARTLQTSLLPAELPRIPGVEVAARYHTGSEDVTGDFYDVFQLRGRQWGIALGDVCGRGPDAAALTAAARHAIRTAAMIERRPSRVLRLVNEALLRYDGERFCTAVFARIEVGEETASISLAIGGHPPPFIVRADGAVEEPPSVGTLLGVLRDVELEDQRIELSLGDGLIFYTDGLTEARRLGGELLGETRLKDVLREAAGLPASEIAQKLEDVAVAWSGDRAGDDMAIVALTIPPRS